MTVGGEVIGWDEMLPRLGEAAGGLVAEELALERLLAREIADRGMTITAQDLDRERQWLTASILGRDLSAVDAGLSALEKTKTDQLIRQIRQRRGLGPVRYASLLRRNAMLRALVRGRVEVLPEHVELAWHIQHGQRVRIRLLVTPTQHEAQRLRNAALGGDPASLELRFAELAQTYSTDPSAPRGGLIEPFSPKDPAYEQSIRQAAAQLKPGQISPIVAIRNGFALVYLDEVLPADGTLLEDVQSTLAEQLRRRQERLLMDTLATKLLAEARVHILDPSLSWSVHSGESR